MNDTDVAVILFVYMIVFIPTKRIIYIGSTSREKQRSNEHLEFRGGAPRVAITFAQSRFQPRKDFFRFDIAWSGSCTIDELHAIEQHFIDRYETRVHPRPRNEGTMDIDLMTCNEPMQLNINNASNRTELSSCATKRVQYNSTLTGHVNALTTLQQCLNIVAQQMDKLSENTAYSIIQRAYTKYAATSRDVSVTEFHADLNDVKKSYTEEDGQELKINLNGMIRTFNKDKRMADDPNYSVRSCTVANNFRTLLCTLNPNAFISCVQTSQHNPPIAKQKCDGIQEWQSKLVAHLAKARKMARVHNNIAIACTPCHMAIETVPVVFAVQ